MSIANELSSDVAVAVLAHEQGEPTIEPQELLGVILEVHTTLRHLTAQARAAGRAPQSSTGHSTTSEAAAGGH